MSLVTPHAAATSSMEVSAKPEDANASAAPAKMAARRSARGNNLLSICIRDSVYETVYTGSRPGGARRRDPGGRGRAMDTDMDTGMDTDAETAQVRFTEAELLADLPVAEPLLAGGVRCHGGFDHEGRYVSPRTRFRLPAIEAWGVQHSRQFGTELIEVPLEWWERSFPSVAQARFLIGAGVPEPLVATLTRIGTVEGYGANIRLLKPKELQRFFVEDIGGTAIDHLGGGLFEAHGRDEAGWDEAAGHRDMWFAARDIAFGRPGEDLDIEAMLARMGFGAGRPGADAPRLLPDDIAPELEMMVTLMVRVLFIEISAFHTFAWAEAWMSDTDLVAGEGEAARLVSYIRADESPHVGYLRTALTEMRDRTWVGEGGRWHAGTDMIGRLWEPLLAQSLGTAREQGRRAALGEVEHWCAQRRNGADVLAEFHSIGAP